MLDILCSIFKQLSYFIPSCSLLSPSPLVKDNIMHFYTDFSVVLDALIAEGFMSSSNCICSAPA